MIEAHLSEALQSCLAALENGENLDDCLERYPDQARDLKALVKTAQFARSRADVHVPHAAFHRSRSRLLVKAAHLSEQRQSRRSWSWFGRKPRIVFAALALAVVFFMSWKGLVESVQALPGDPLYPIKRSAEDARLRIIPDAHRKRAIQVQFERRRVGEVTELLVLGRVVDVTFEGVLQERDSQRWTIDSVPVTIAPQTQIAGNIENGQVVEVSGTTQANGEVLASTIRLHSYQLIGQVESISPAEWVVSGIKLRVSRESQIDPAARVHDHVIVLVEVEEDQALKALAILRLLQPDLIIEEISEPTRTTRPNDVPQNEEIELFGLVEAMAADAWTIAGREVLISDTTEFKDSVALGDHVKVHALVQADGSLIAREIELDNSSLIDENEDDGGEDDEAIESGEDHGVDDDQSGTDEDGSNPEVDDDSPDDDHSSDDNSDDSEDNIGPGGGEDGHKNGEGDDDGGGGDDDGSDDDSGGDDNDHDDVGDDDGEDDDTGGGDDHDEIEDDQAGTGD